MTAAEAARLLHVTPAGARRILERLVQAGILDEFEDEWPRLFVVTELLDVIQAPTMST